MLEDCHKIISLAVENVKRVKVVFITPKGKTIVIGGENGQGKSSVLDAIEYVLGGARGLPPMPLRKGAKQGRIVADLGGVIVERTFEEGGKSELIVKSKDGYLAPTPQTLLDDLCGRFTFDPLKFVNQSPKDQLETLKDLVGLDFTDADAQRKRLYDDRTEVNRTLKSAKARVESMPVHADVPKKEVDVSELMAQLKEREAIKSANIQTRMAHESDKATLDKYATACDEIREQIKALQERLAKGEALHAEMKVRVKAGAAEVENLVDSGTDEIRRQIETASATNRKVAENARRAQEAKQLDELTKQSEGFTAEIELIDARKDKQMKAAKFPVEGLGFEEYGVSFNGIPFQQASSAEQLRVSVAMAFQMNPGFKVARIKDGSLLNDESFAAVCEMVEKCDGQLWIERVGADSGPCSVIIEDGHIQGVEVEQLETATA